MLVYTGFICTRLGFSRWNNEWMEGGVSGCADKYQDDYCTVQQKRVLTSQSRCREWCETNEMHRVAAWMFLNLVIGWAFPPPLLITTADELWSQPGRAGHKKGLCGSMDHDGSGGGFRLARRERSVGSPRVHCRYHSNKYWGSLPEPDDVSYIL